MCWGVCVEMCVERGIKEDKEGSGKGYGCNSCLAGFMSRIK